MWSNPDRYISKMKLKRRNEDDKMRQDLAIYVQKQHWRMMRVMKERQDSLDRDYQPQLQSLVQNHHISKPVCQV